MNSFVYLRGHWSTTSKLVDTPHGAQSIGPPFVNYGVVHAGRPKVLANTGMTSMCWQT